MADTAVPEESGAVAVAEEPTAPVAQPAHGGHDDHGHDAGGHGHSSTGLSNNKLAMWLFLGSECLLFGTLIATYLAYKGRSVIGPHPHEILNIPLTTISTFDLLMSSLLMVLALAAVQRGDRRQAVRPFAARASAGS